MFKKLSGLLVAGLVVSGCNDSVPAGGVGYFDTVGTPPPPPVQQFTPQPPQTQAPGDMTSSLNAAVNEALTATAPANAANIGTTPTTETASATPGIDPVTGAQIVTDDGSIDLNQFSLDQQIVDRTEAARLLEEARANRVVIEPGQIPEVIAGVNIAEYARSTTHQVGERKYRRPVIRTRRSECNKFGTADEAQRYFLANGGPENDPLNLDGDGDGFACAWNPNVYRQLQ